MRDALCATARALHTARLCVGTSGNVSVRTARGFLVTPTGVPYPALEPADLVELNLEGAVLDGVRLPSSEWRLHAALYRARADAQAIVHTHSRSATALACARRGIPAFHYLVARAGGADIRCAAYATYGTPELAAHAVAALADRRACLLANHGMVALGRDLDTAFALAEEVEELAAQYLASLAAGPPVLLDDEEMARAGAKLAAYGQPRSLR
jgi:L-fuculose-phosphate aldolase